MKISVVIPNYNGLEGLKKNLPNIEKEDFYNVYVIDDASTDESLRFVENYPWVKIVRGKKNLGPAGNRNRILREKVGDVIFFIDADTELLSRNIEESAEKLFKDKSVGMVGGKVLTKKRKAMYWNYGYEMHPIKDAIAFEYEKLFNRFKSRRDINKFLRKEGRKYFFNLEIASGKDKERIVDWVAESNFLIRTDIFRKVGGFDEKMRCHEAHDLGKKVRQLEKTVKYSPEIVIRHLEIECREDESSDFENGLRRFYGKYWGMNDQIFDLLYSTEKNKKKK